MRRQLGNSLKNLDGLKVGGGYLAFPLMLSEGEARVEFGPEIGASLGQSCFNTLKLTGLLWKFQETLDLKI